MDPQHFNMVLIEVEFVIYGHVNVLKGTFVLERLVFPASLCRPATVPDAVEHSADLNDTWVLRCHNSSIAFGHPSISTSD